MQVWQALRSTVSVTAAIMLVLAASSAFSWVLTFERVPQGIAEAMLTITDHPILLLCIISIIVLIAGAFIEGTALILILGPIFACNQCFGHRPCTVWSCVGAYGPSRWCHSASRHDHVYHVYNYEDASYGFYARGLAYDYLLLGFRSSSNMCARV